MDEEIVEPFLKEDGNLEAQRRQKKKKDLKKINRKRCKFNDEERIY